MRKSALLPLSVALLATPCAAKTCEELRSEISAKIQAAGVRDFTVTIVDSASGVPGRVVGSCEQGTKKIVYVQATGGGAAKTPTAKTPAPQPKKSPVLTECRDGTVSMGGDCRK